MTTERAKSLSGAASVPNSHAHEYAHSGTGNAIPPLTIRIAGRDYPVTITKTSNGFEYRTERNAEEFWGCCRTLAGAVIEARESLQCWGDEPESAEDEELLEVWLQASVAVVRGRKVA